MSFSSPPTLITGSNDSPQTSVTSQFPSSSPPSPLLDISNSTYLLPPAQPLSQSSQHQHPTPINTTRFTLTIDKGHTDEYSDENGNGDTSYPRKPADFPVGAVLHFFQHHNVPSFLEQTSILLQQSLESLDSLKVLVTEFEATGALPPLTSEIHPCTTSLANFNRSLPSNNNTIMQSPHAALIEGESVELFHESNLISSNNYPSYAQLNRFTPNIQQMLDLSYDESQLPLDYDKILLLNVEGILKDIFTTSFHPLLTSLQQQWEPLFAYQQQSPQTTTNHQDPDDINTKLHTQPITAIIELHMESLQTLLTFHATHRDERISKIQRVIDHWVSLVKHLAQYNSQLESLRHDYYETKRNEIEKQNKQSTFQQNIVKSDELTNTNTYYAQKLQNIAHDEITFHLRELTNAVSILTSNLDKYSFLHRKYKIYQSHLKSECNINQPNTLFNFDEKNNREEDNNILILSSHEDKILLPHQNFPQLSSNLAKRTVQHKNIKYSFFNIPLSLLLNIVSYLELSDLHNLKQVNYSHFKLFNNPLITKQLLLNTLNSIQETVFLKRINQQRVEDLFMSGTKCHAVIPKTAQFDDIEHKQQLLTIAANKLTENSTTSPLSNNDTTPASPIVLTSPPNGNSGSWGFTDFLWGQPTPSTTNNITLPQPRITSTSDIDQEIKHLNFAFLEQIFSSTSEFILKRIAQSEAQRDEYRTQLTAVQPLVSFLISNTDAARIEYLKLQHFRDELTNKLTQYSNEKKVTLYKITQYEQKLVTLEEQLVSFMKTHTINVNTIKQRIQLLEDVNFTSNTNSNSGATNSMNLQLLSNDEKQVVENLKLEKRSLIKQIKLLRTDIQNHINIEQTTTNNIHKIFHAKVEHDHSHIFNFVQCSSLNEAKKAKKLTKYQERFDISLKLPTFEEFLALNNENGASPDHATSISTKSNIHGSPTAYWDVKNFITIIDKNTGKELKLGKKLDKAFKRE